MPRPNAILWGILDTLWGRMACLVLVCALLSLCLGSPSRLVLLSANQSSTWTTHFSFLFTPGDSWLELLADRGSGRRGLPKTSVSAGSIPLQAWIIPPFNLRQGRLRLRVAQSNLQPLSPPDRDEHDRPIFRQFSGTFVSWLPLRLRPPILVISNGPRQRYQ